MEVFCGRGTEMSKQLKRKVDIRCLQEVRWRGQGARFAAIKGRRCKWYWFGSNNGIGVGILVQEELCEKVVEVRRKLCQNDDNGAGF